MQNKKLRPYWPLILLIITESFDLKSESSKTILYIINKIRKKKFIKEKEILF